MNKTGKVGLIGCGWSRTPVAAFLRMDTTSDAGETAHIYVNGQIVPEQSDYASEWGIVSLNTILNALNEVAEGTKTLVVHINSPGGYVDEGFAIHNTLQTFKRETGIKLVTRADGQCASIATVILLAGDEREIYNNSQPFIHNPWTDPWSLPGQLEANDLENLAKQMRQEEDRILDFYVSKTGADRDTLAALMEAQTALTADQALELKFATVVLTDIKAMARLTIDPKNRKTKMAKPKKTVAQAAAELKAAAKKAGILALNLTTTDGKTLDITAAGDTPAEGDEVAIEGAPAPDGEYEVDGGDKITVTAGKITAVTPADPGTGTGSGDDEGAGDAAQAAQIKTLKDENKKISAKNADLEKRLKALEAKMSADETEADNLVNLVQDLTQRLENVKTGFVPSQRQNNKGGAEVNEDRIDRANRRKAEREAAAAAEKK